MDFNDKLVIRQVCVWSETELDKHVVLSINNNYNSHTTTLNICPEIKRESISLSM